MIKDLEVGGYLGLSRWVLNAITCILIERRQREVMQTQRRRQSEDKAERLLKMLALEVGEMWP